MTIKELIEKLSRFDDDLPVFIDDLDEGISKSVGKIHFESEENRVWIEASRR